MNSRGFFSVILATFAVVLLIALIYAQSVRSETDAKANQLLVLQQELSKNWFMARNAYSNFAADAIANQIQNTIGVEDCTLNPPPGPDFSDNIKTYWGNVHTKLLTKGIRCEAVLSNSLYNDLENPDHSTLAVFNNERAYGILTCLSSAGGMDLNMTQPFVIRKEVVLTAIDLTHCRVQIFDNLGVPSTNPPVSHVATDVEFTYS